MSQLFKIMLFSSSFAAGSLCATGTEGQAPAHAAQNQPHQQTHQQTHRDFSHTHTHPGGHTPLPPSIQNHPLHRQASGFQQQIDEDEDVPASKKKHTTKKLLGVSAATAVAGAILAQQGALDGLPIVGKDGEAGGEGGEAADAG
jgi:hypothetical protein